MNRLLELKGPAADAPGEAASLRRILVQAAAASGATFAAMAVLWGRCVAMLFDPAAVTLARRQKFLDDELPIEYYSRESAERRAMRRAPAAASIKGRSGMEWKGAPNGCIGVFDSGVGGLSVWREIAARSPREDTIYVADQAHVPYGSRSLAEVQGFSEGIARFLLGRGAKVIVIACNAASAASLHELRDLFPEVPFVGMEPAVKPAIERTRSGVVGVIATEATFQGKLFASLMAAHGDKAEVITQVGRGLVPAVEAGALDAPETEDLLRECLAPLLDAGMDQLVLGCTHYPFLRPLIERIVGPGVAVIDPAPAVAAQTARVLSQGRIENVADHAGRHQFYTSGDTDAFARMLRRLVPELSLGAGVLAVGWEEASLASR